MLLPLSSSSCWVSEAENTKRFANVKGNHGAGASPNESCAVSQLYYILRVVARCESMRNVSAAESFVRQQCREFSEEFSAWQDLDGNGLFSTPRLLSFCVGTGRVTLLDYFVFRSILEHGLRWRICRNKWQLSCWVGSGTGLNWTELSGLNESVLLWMNWSLKKVFDFEDRPYSENEGLLLWRCWNIWKTCRRWWWCLTKVLARPIESCTLESEMCRSCVESVKWRMSNLIVRIDANELFKVEQLRNWIKAMGIVWLAFLASGRVT